MANNPKLTPGGVSRDDADKAGDRDQREGEQREFAQNRELISAERLEMFRESFNQEVLPKLPDIPGFHVCWLTTTNPRDSIPHRLRMGYELIKADSIPEWNYPSLKTGEFAGMVMINEMIAARIPVELHHMYMKEAHYDAPARERQKLTDTLDQIKMAAEGTKGMVIEESGMEALRRSAAIPTFQG